MARICSASQWTGSSTEPPGCVAEACSLLAFPARHQQSSSAASTAVQAVQQRPAAGSLQEQVQEQGRFAGAVSDKRLQQLLVALLGEIAGRQWAGLALHVHITLWLLGLKL